MKKILVFGVAFLAAVLSLNLTVSAQQCECVDGLKCFRVNDILECDPYITCEGSVVVTPPIPSDPRKPVNSLVLVQSITASFQSATLGQVNIHSTGGPLGRIQSNSSNVRFPLTVELNFDAFATLPSLPGQRFYSTEPLSYVTHDAQSVDPFYLERLTLANSVQFADVNGVVAFTLEAGNSVISLRGL